ncbi:hypothetical protein AAFF_G00016870 [Aldrovandia affinis]|uniref:Uncharacterized protein n=1 Tax=Aldrovandia affinis TaxID=143900 RepID=A0AAD7S8A7_9TELE|nr:hypothetical protein AAFF_G00016870 [Aldrovandia affinis]
MDCREYRATCVFVPISRAKRVGRQNGQTPQPNLGAPDQCKRGLMAVQGELGGGGCRARGPDVPALNEQRLKTPTEPTRNRAGSREESRGWIQTLVCVTDKDTGSARH